MAVQMASTQSNLTNASSTIRISSLESANEETFKIGPEIIQWTYKYIQA